MGWLHLPTFMLRVGGKFQGREFAAPGPLSGTALALPPLSLSVSCQLFHPACLPFAMYVWCLHMMMHYHPSPFLGEHLREVAHVPAEDEDVAEEGHHQQLPVVAQHVHRVHPLNPPVQVLTEKEAAAAAK